MMKKRNRHYQNCWRFALKLNDYLKEITVKFPRLGQLFSFM